MRATWRVTLHPLLAAVLLLAPAAGPSVMALAEASAGHVSGHHHHHTTPDRPDGHHRADGCCDFCLAGCETAPGPATPAIIVPALTISLDPPTPTHTGRLIPLPVPPRLPFSQGPPALLV